MKRAYDIASCTSFSCAILAGFSFLSRVELDRLSASKLLLFHVLGFYARGDCEGVQICFSSFSFFFDLVSCFTAWISAQRGTAWDRVGGPGWLGGAGGLG